MLCGGNNFFLINKENSFIFVDNYVHGDFEAHDPSPSTPLKLMSTTHSSGLELGNIKINLLVLVTNNLSQYSANYSCIMHKLIRTNFKECCHSDLTNPM